VNAYPRQHAGLFAAIARSGGLVCEFADKPVGGGWLFLQRNRLIAALATTVVVVQAPYKSGALSTAHWAKSLGRRMLVVPAAPWDEHGKGCLELLRSGAEICTSAMDILLVPPSEPRGRRKRSRLPKELNHHATLAPCSRTVWKCVRCGVSHPDEIAATLDMPAAEVQEALLDLLLRGLCRQRADGGYVADE
jgi:DNA processing protein